MQDMQDLLAIMRRLRDPQHGCPWDREQTFATLVPHTLEEAYEVADAIERDDMAGLCEELGDLLFQVVFYAQLGAEQGAFDFAAVARGIAEKLIRRHPHVFGEAQVSDAAAQTAAWEAHKADERQAKARRAGRRPSLLDDVARALPALSRAAKLQRRAARVGFDWPAAPPVLDKLHEEAAELAVEMGAPDGPGQRARLRAELGDLLFTCVNLARHLDVDPEMALREANAKFERRFRRLEERLAPLEQAGPQTLDREWERIKAEERGAD